MAEYRHYAVPNPEWVDFPNNLPLGTHVHGMNRDRLPIKPQEGLHIEEFDVPARDDYPVRIRIYRKPESNDLPLFIYMHGGGYVTGSLETDDRSCRKIAAEIDVLVLSIEYRLAPEHKFPIGFGDAYDVVKWATLESSQAQLRINLTKGFVLGGTSAGANFTAGISHLARDKALSPPLSGLIFLAGSFCHPDARPEEYRDRILSVDEINDAPGLTRKSIDYFAAKYGAPPSDKRLSPLLFESHANLAKKALFSVCGWDPRRDEAILLEHILRSEGVDTRIKIHSGLPHGFWATCPELPVSLAWEQEFVRDIRWILQ
ncbi:hypothetical protein LTR84_003784 [Exophiala bonariae]|uniref:Alpha/beta hydrolase fold-3 domain-containing protein n=1 Tax=Exophiala bonariae TaxID=1690606 RepID=A0AAV9NA72_9EURO|nr:hypothetical protein LTR84_003784 [Exophiala bonariae]